MAEEARTTQVIVEVETEGPSRTTQVIVEAETTGPSRTTQVIVEVETSPALELGYSFWW